MKKIFAIIISLLFVIILCACTNDVLKTEEVLQSEVIGNWVYKENGEDMQHFSEYIYFYEDGSFLSSTWREKCEGKYQIDGNKIEARYDYYFNPAGSKQYFYQYSGIKTFELIDEKLRLLKDTTDDGTYEYYKIYERIL